MYLAYLDDSGSDAKSPVVLVGAVIIEDALFAHVEKLLGTVVEGLLPDDRQKSFQEFHATELFWGNGVFTGIPEEQRHDAIRELLRIVKQCRLPFIYSAIDRGLLAASPMGSAHPVDTAFRMCSLGIQDWLQKQQQRLPQDGPLRPGHSREPLCLFVMDDTKDGALKNTIRKSFKRLRVIPPDEYGKPVPRRLALVHDDMYFGSSADSIGIQISDVCSFFMMRHIRDGQDQFFELFRTEAKCAMPDPEWMIYRGVFRHHK